MGTKRSVGVIKKRPQTKQAKVKSALPTTTKTKPQSDLLRLAGVGRDRDVTTSLFTAGGKLKAAAPMHNTGRPPALARVHYGEKT